MKFFNLKPNRYFEGEGEGESEGEGEGEGEKKVITPTPTPTTTTFTQEQVNKFLAEEKRKAQKANEKVVKQLEDLKKNQSLTEEEKQNLENRIETIRNEFLTKEELARKEALKEKNKQKNEVEAKDAEAKKWRKLYEETTVETSLMKASSSDPDVYNPEQMMEMLLPKSKLVEELDPENNSPTGRFITKIRLNAEDKDGKTVTLELSPSDAIKQMKEMKKYENQFINKATGGIGGNNNANGKRNNGMPPTDNQVAYREWRKKNPNFTGI